MGMWSINVPTTEGIQSLDLGPEERAEAAAHRQAALHYRDTGDYSRLARFGGVRLGGYELETDPREIERLARQHQLDFEDFYEDA